VPQAGLDLLAVGLSRFEATLGDELDQVAFGRGHFKAVRGEYGCGKTFFGRWLQEQARGRGFATSEVQASETETPLHRMETVYRRLCERLATSEGDGAFRSVIDGWFDRIHHDRLIARLGQTIPDKRILRLVGLILRSGIMADGLVTPSTEGAVQGSPLSPLLSNIVLDELDKELERRGLEFCRFADDSNIFVKTPKAAERVMASIGGYIEKRLKLVVNREKSQVARSERVKFLGMTIVGDTIAISHKALQGAMAKVKELTPRGTHLTLEASIERINSWYAGWSSYFAMTYYPSQLKKIEAHIRRRLRSRLVDQQKSRRNLFRKLVKRGVPRPQAATAVFSNKGRWALSHTFAVSRAYPVGWFVSEMGQAIRSNGQLPHWFDVDRWIRLP
jgi:hypothetical protein